MHASSASEIEQAFDMLAQRKVGALLIAPGLFILHDAKIAALTARYALPASHERRVFPDVGGLMSYGANQAEGLRLAGVFAGRVLKGENPSNIDDVITSARPEPAVNHVREICFLFTKRPR
jgi:hypothetical protein